MAASAGSSMAHLRGCRCRASELYDISLSFVSMTVSHPLGSVLRAHCRGGRAWGRHCERTDPNC